MTIQTSIKGDTVYVKIVGAIDTDGGVKLSAEFQNIIAQAGVLHGDFDLREVPSITSAGIGKLLKLFKHFDKKGGSMKISGITQSLKEQFEEIHLNQIIPIV